MPECRIRIVALAVLFLTAVSIPAISAMEPQIDTVVGTGQPENNGDRGIATAINVGDPFGVEIGPDGSLYVAEVRNHRVWRVDLTNQTITCIAGNGTKGYSGDQGPATKAQLNEPYEIRFDSAGNMFFVEMQNHLIRRVDAETGIISTVAGTGAQGYGGDGGPAKEARFNRPHSIALDGQGGLYVADIGNHRIRRIDLNTQMIDTIAGTGESTLPADGKIARGRPMLGPRALFIEGDSIWIALREGHSIWRMSLRSGHLQHIAGTGKKGYSGDGEQALKATFNGPKGIAVAPDGSVLVVDTENQVIRRIDMQTRNISTVAGCGRQGGAGDRGLATLAELARPHGICIDQNGTIYIGDTLNHRVRRVK